jgi:DNA primase
MPSHDSALEEIKDRIDIIDLISEYVNLKKAGQNWKGLCPFHTEKTPSFTVSPAKQIYHCFGCGSGGDIFTFLVKYENLTFPEALNILARKAGVTLKSSRRSPEKKGEKEILLNAHKEALYFFRQNLSRNPKALEYLKKRGIGEDYQKKFSLGYAPKSWNALLTYLTRKGYKPDAIKSAGLAAQGSKGFYDAFRDRIIFPIYDLKSDAVAFGGRSIDGSEPKYLNSPETPIFNKRKVLYGLSMAKDHIKDAGYALFMEGYLDVIMTHMHGFSNAVAPLGTALTGEHGKLIKRFAEDIIIVFDSDRAGRAAAKKAAGILLESGLHVKILSFPENEDPDSFLRKNGREAFQSMLEKPLSIIDFFMLQKGDKRLIAREALETISRVPDKILQGIYIKTLAERLNVEERYVREEFQRVKNQVRGGLRNSPPRTQRGSKPSDLEIFIVKLILQLPERSKEIVSAFSREDFKSRAMGSIFQKLQEGTKDFNELLSFCDEEERALLTEVSFKDDFESPEKVLNDCIERAGRNRRELHVQEIDRKIREAESIKDIDSLNKLLVERQKLMSVSKK